MKLHEGFQIKPHKQYPSSYIVVTDGRGGKIPNVLSGMFTSPKVAVETIDAYLAVKPVKAKDSDKEISQG
jgi:NCAIR mutase (PurE)-related protein